jgi:hypothetical protein
LRDSNYRAAEERAVRDHFESEDGNATKRALREAHRRTPTLITKRELHNWRTNMEIKQVTQKEGLARAEKRLTEAAEAAQNRMRAELNDELKHLRDAAAGVQALQEGLGTLLDRSEAIFVTAFRVESNFATYADLKELYIGGAELRFPEHQYVIRLDPGRQFGGPTPDTPSLKPDANYRAIVLIERIDQTQEDEDVE